MLWRLVVSLLCLDVCCLLCVSVGSGARSKNRLQLKSMKMKDNRRRRTASRYWILNDTMWNSNNSPSQNHRRVSSCWNCLNTLVCHRESDWRKAMDWMIFCTCSTVSFQSPLLIVHRTCCRLGTFVGAFVEDQSKERCPFSCRVVVLEWLLIVKHWFMSSLQSTKQEQKVCTIPKTATREMSISFDTDLHKHTRNA